jgi:predicted dehydrogenase
MKSGVAIIGAGLQARRRIPAVAADPRYEITTIVARTKDRVDELAGAYGAESSTDWTAAVTDPRVDAVLCLTYPDKHAEISIAAMEAGKHVLCEKPLARTLAEAQAMVDTAKACGRILKCGFNHRFHPALAEAHRLFEDGLIGEPVFGRARYGFAGRPQHETEWRADPDVVSGGQLMELGIHVIDLFRWFLGDFVEVAGMTATNYWPIDPLEDNGFALLRGENGAICSVHASLTQWTNLFEFELFGRTGSLAVHGLGGSYGVEQLRTSTYDPTGPFSHTTTEFRGADTSWRREWENFTAAIAGDEPPLGDGVDGLRAMEIVDAVYSASKSGRVMELR